MYEKCPSTRDVPRARTRGRRTTRPWPRRHGAAPRPQEGSRRLRPTGSPSPPLRPRALAHAAPGPRPRSARRAVPRRGEPLRRPRRASSARFTSKASRSAVNGRSGARPSGASTRLPPTPRPCQHPTGGELGECRDRGGGRDRMAGERVGDRRRHDHAIGSEQHRGQRDVQVAVGALVGEEADCPRRAAPRAARARRCARRAAPARTTRPTGSPPLLSSMSPDDRLGPSRHHRVARRAPRRRPRAGRRLPVVPATVRRALRRRRVPSGPHPRRRAPAMGHPARRPRPAGEHARPARALRGRDERGRASATTRSS